MASKENNGFKAYSNLEEYNVDTGLSTGNVKPNSSGDPHYVPPVYDISECPLRGVELNINPHRYDANFIDFFSVQLSSEGPWHTEINRGQSWLVLSKTSGPAESTTINIQARRNDTTNMRTGIVEFHLNGEFDEALIIYQQSMF